MTTFTTRTNAGTLVKELLGMDDDERVALVKSYIGSLSEYAHQCHAASVRLMNSGFFAGPRRIARGTAYGVGGQHSWLVLGKDCYDPESWVVDITRWSYDPSAPRVEVCRNDMAVHRPHGSDGSIWEWGKPPCLTTDHVKLTEPEGGWSPEARMFLSMLGPLDRRGWGTLCGAPVKGWPAAEIIAAVANSGMTAFIPIDRLGMLTDRNPQGLYLPTETEEA